MSKCQTYGKYSNRCLITFTPVRPSCHCSLSFELSKVTTGLFVLTLVICAHVDWSGAWREGSASLALVSSSSSRVVSRIFTFIGSDGDDHTDNKDTFSSSALSKKGFYSRSFQINQFSSQSRQTKEVKHSHHGRLCSNQWAWHSVQWDNVSLSSAQAFLLIVSCWPSDSTFRLIQLDHYLRRVLNLSPPLSLSRSLVSNSSTTPSKSSTHW